MLMKRSPPDFAIIGAYFCLVLGVGYWLKDKMKTSSDFLLSNGNFSHWITGIAFVSANLGALEARGHTANGAKYGTRTNHWYWTGAIPAMVFLGLFMVRYYYANGVRSVPGYLRMRYDYPAHVLNAFSFAIVTIPMDYMQLIGILFISPFFIVFLLGMFWERPSATAGCSAWSRDYRAPLSNTCFLGWVCSGLSSPWLPISGRPCGVLSGVWW